MVDFLDSVTLQDLVDEQRNKRSSPVSEPVSVRRQVMFQEPRTVQDTTAA
jgi:hypothetical protein